MNQYKEFFFRITCSEAGSNNCWIALSADGEIPEPGSRAYTIHVFNYVRKCLEKAALNNNSLIEYKIIFSDQYSMKGTHDTEINKGLQHNIDLIVPITDKKEILFIYDKFRKQD